MLYELGNMQPVGQGVMHMDGHRHDKDPQKIVKET
jgi:hypothetical protein